MRFHFILIVALCVAVHVAASLDPNQRILLPSIYDTDLTDLHNLDPQKDLKVYYEEGGQGMHAAFVTFTDLHHPTVVLEHSSYIAKISCTGTTISLHFSGKFALTYALKVWESAISEGIIFVTNVASCSDGYPAERGWLLVSSIQKQGSLTISCGFTEVLAADVTKAVEAEFGQLNREGTQRRDIPKSISAGTLKTTFLSSSKTSSKTSEPKASNSGKSSFLTSTKGSSKSSSISSTAPQSVTTSKISTLISKTSSLHSSTSSQSQSPASAAPLNTIQDFDTELDDALGYLDPNSPTFWSQLLPGVPSSEISTFGSPTRRLHRRGWDLASIGNSLITVRRIQNYTRLIICALIFISIVDLQCCIKCRKHCGVYFPIGIKYN